MPWSLSFFLFFLFRFYKDEDLHISFPFFLFLRPADPQGSWVEQFVSPFPFAGVRFPPPTNSLYFIIISCCCLWIISSLHILRGEFAVPFFFPFPMRKKTGLSYFSSLITPESSFLFLQTAPRSKATLRIPGPFPPPPPPFLSETRPEKSKPFPSFPPMTPKAINHTSRFPAPMVSHHLSLIPPKIGYAPSFFSQRKGNSPFFPPPPPKARHCDFPSPPFKHDNFPLPPPLFFMGGHRHTITLARFFFFFLMEPAYMCPLPFLFFLIYHNSPAGLLLFSFFFSS